MRSALVATMLGLMAVPALAVDSSDPGSSHGSSPSSESASSSGPVQVKIGLYLLNIGKLDVASGTYTADFYLQLDSDRDMGDVHLEFMNGRAASTDVLKDKPTSKLYRMQANLMANLDLRRYPWDEHDLPIVLESATRETKEIVFVEDTKVSAVDPSVIFVGWRLQGFSATVVNHSYAPAWDETYSQVTYKIHIGRMMLISSLKTFLPVLCFILIVFASLLVTIERLDSRIGMNTAMLIASVMFHLSITNQLPPAAYLTIADKALVATYVTIGLSLFLSVLMMRLVQKERMEAAKALRDRAFKIVPAFAVVAFAVVAILH